jgi:hypothetical protein
MRPIETIPGMRGEGEVKDNDEGGELECAILDIM